METSTPRDLREPLGFTDRFRLELMETDHPQQDSVSSTHFTDRLKSELIKLKSPTSKISSSSMNKIKKVRDFVLK